MDKRFSIYNIAEILAEKTGKEIAEIEKFLHELIALINEGIIKDQSVSIKGIGTFKVVLVKERESVSVNTGERIVIPPHHKLTFIPLKVMKDLINKPFASFDAIETSEDDNGLADYFISEKGRRSEKEDLPVNEEQPPVVEHVRADEKQEKDETGDEGLTEETVYQEPPRPLPDSGIIGQTQDENLVSPPPLPTPPPPPLPSEFIPPPPPFTSELIPPPQVPLSSESTPPQLATHIPPPLPPPQAPHPHNERKGKGRKKKSAKTSTKLLLGILFFLLFILVGGGGWYFFFYSKSTDDIYSGRLNSRIAGERMSTLSTDPESPGQSLDETDTALDSTVYVQPEINESDTTKTEVAESVSEPVSEPPVSTTTPETASPKTTTGQATTTSPQTTTGQATTTSPQTTTATGNNVMARVVMESGQRLTLISEKYYGLKVFWVYIYEFNREKIGSNPDRIPVGMEILVPTKELYDIDATSTASVERATALQRRIMAGY